MYSIYICGCSYYEFADSLHTYLSLIVSVLLKLVDLGNLICSKALKTLITNN